jgi:ATP-binding cassette subfamily B protein
VLRNKSSLLRRVLWQSRRCWPHLFLIFLLSLLAMALNLIVPLPLKIAVDSIGGASPLPGFLKPYFPQLTQGGGLLLAVGLMMSTALLINLQGLCSGWLQTYTGEKLVWDFRAQLLDHVQRLPMSFHDRNGTLDSAYRIQHDAPAIQYVMIQGLVPMSTAIATLVIMLYVCMRLDLQVSLIALSIAVPLFLLTRACSRQIRSRSMVVKELDSSAIGVVQEVLGSIRIVKAFGQEAREYERFVRHSQKRQSRQVKLALTQGAGADAAG